MPSAVKKTKATKVSKDANKDEEVKSPKFVSDSLEKKQIKRKAESKAAKASKKGVNKVNLTKKKKRGIVYIKHLPHGFFEDQLKGYFTQFGAVTRLRLARSTRTLNSKGYAFIEFKYPEVAQIAAEAMNNYIMFKQIIKTAYIGPEEVKYDYFRSGIRRTWKDDRMHMSSKTTEAREQIVEGNNRLMTTEDEVKRNKIVHKKIKKDADKLASLGVDYDLAVITGHLPDTLALPIPSATPMDDDDETFNLSNVNVESDDEVMDLDCSQNSEDDDDEDVEPKVDVVAVKKAVKFAEDVKKTVQKKEDAPVPTKKAAAKSNGQKKDQKKKEVVAAKTPEKKAKSFVAAPEPEVIEPVAKKAGKKGKKEKLEPQIPTPQPEAPKKKEKKTKATSEAPAVGSRASARAPKARIESPVVEKPTKVKNAKKPKVKAVAAPEPTLIVPAKSKKALPSAPVPAEPKDTKTTKIKAGKVTKKMTKIPAEKLKKAAKALIQEEPAAAKSKAGKKAKK